MRERKTKLKKSVFTRFLIICLPLIIFFSSNALSATTYPDFNNAGYKNPINPFDQWGNAWYECTRYAFGRTYEKTGITLLFSSQYGRHGGKWYDLVLDLSRGPNPQSNSIAVWSYGEYGHVAFVEDVNGDNITISEANFASPTNGLFNGFKTLTINQMKNRGSYTLVGYIYLSVNKSLIQKTGDSVVYWLQNQKIYHVSNDTILKIMQNALIPDWNRDIISVPGLSAYINNGLEFISTSTASNGIYIQRYPKTQYPDVYQINNGKKEYVSFDACNAANCWNDTIEVSQEILDIFPTLSTIEQSILAEKIANRLKQQIPIPPYLLDANTFDGSISTIWLNFTSTELVKLYGELYMTGIDYYYSRINALRKAKHFLENGDIVNAEKYVNKSDQYWKRSNIAFNAAVEVYNGNVDAASMLVQGIKNGSEASLYVASILVPAQVVAADWVHMIGDYAVQKVMAQNPDADKELIVKLLLKGLFEEIKFEKLGGQTVSDYMKAKSVGALGSPVLDDLTKAVEWNTAIKNILANTGVTLTQQVIEDIATKMANQASTGLISVAQASSGIPADVQNAFSSSLSSNSGWEGMNEIHKWGDYWVQDVFRASDFNKGILIYNADVNKVFLVMGDIWKFVYEPMGGPGSWLGLPMSNEVSYPVSDSPHNVIQRFKNGYITHFPGNTPYWRAYSNEPYIVSNLKITSPRPSPAFYNSGETLTAEFTITNQGGQSITLDTLTVGGRLNGDNTCNNINPKPNPNTPCADFTHKTSADIPPIAPGASYTYKGTLTVAQTGNYQFFPAYKIGDVWKTKDEIPKVWGVQNTLDITVNEKPVAPTVPYDFATDATPKEMVAPQCQNKACTKTWRITNTGTTTWNTGYKLVYDSGYQMGGASVSIPSAVAPEGTKDITVNLTAPDTSGTFNGYWRLQNSSGVKFGEKLSVQIVVPDAVTNTVTTPKDGDLIQATGNPKVYLVKGGRKWWIKNETIFAAMSYNWDVKKEYPASTVDAILSGPTIVDNGSLIRVTGYPYVYLIQNGQKRWITDIPTFTGNGFKWEDVIEVRSAVGDMYPRGADITTPPRVMVISPNSGDSLTTGTPYSILWSAVDDCDLCSPVISSVSIYYSTNGGTSWSPLTTGLSNSGSYQWTPTTASSSMKIKIVATDGSGVTGEAMSNTFSVNTVYTYADLTINSLSLSASTVDKGQQITATTTVSNLGNGASGATNVKYYFSSTSTGKDVYLGQSSLPSLTANGSTTLTASITIPSTAGLTGYIVAVANPDNAISESTSGNNMASASVIIKDSVAPTITYLSFPSYSFFRTGGKYSIVFEASDNIGVQSTGFYYSTDNVNWTTITSYFIPGSNGFSNGYEWTVPTTLSTPGNIYIKMIARDASGNSVEKIAGPYTLKDGTAPGVTLLSPNGGEVWDLNSSQTITWNVNSPNGISKLRLYIYWGSSAEFIADVTTNTTGSYSWTVPNSSSFVTNGARIKIRLEDLNGNTNEDWSDNYFSIRDASAPPPAPWTTPELLTSGGATSPRVVTDKNGVLHLLYNNAVYKKLVGTSWSSPVTIDASGLAGDAAIAVDSNGYPHVAYRKGTGMSGDITVSNYNDIYYAYFNGSSWSTPVNISENIPGTPSSTTLAWATKASLPVAGSATASAVVNGKLYVFGSGIRSNNYEYNPSTNIWTKKADVPGNGIGEGGAAAINNKIYAFGDPFDFNVKIYDPAADTWTTGAKLSYIRGAAIAAVSGKLYIIGGGDGSNNAFNTVYEYNPATNSFATKTSMPTARMWAASAVVNNKIYVIGGYGSGTINNIVEVYDPSTDSWTTGATMPTYRSGAFASVVNDKIYVIGGGGWSGYLTTVEEYNPATNNWLSKTSMSTARTSAAGGAINSNICVVGGLNSNGELSVNEQVTITSSGSTTVSDMPKISIDPSNNVHIVWRDGFSWNSDYTRTGAANIYYRKKDSSGNWSSVSQVTTSGGGESSINSDTTGNLHLVYTFDSDKIAYMKWDGTSWSSPVTISTTSYGLIDVALDKSNNPHAVWFYNDSTDGQQILYSYHDGAAWSTPEKVSNAALEGYPLKPSIVIDSSDRTHVIYEENKNKNRILYKYKDSNGWSSPTQINLSSQSVEQYSSDMAISPTDNIHVVWQSSYNSNGEVFYNHADVSGIDISSPTVSVNSPSTGNTLSIGSTSNITWTATDNTGVTSITLEYSTDGGSSYTLIAGGEANDGVYEWTLPNVASGNAQIRITALDVEGNQGIGLSGTFSISDKTAPSITLTSPNGGESLTAGSQKSIQWTSNDNVGASSVDIYLSVDNGASWSSLASGLSNTGSYTWTVPSTPSSAARIKVVIKDTAGNMGQDQSDWNFAIASGNRAPNTPAVTAPANGLSNSSINALLSWTGGDPDTGDTVTYDVYFGTSSNPPLISGEQSATSFSPGTLAYNSIYYWRIVAKDNRGNSSASPTWSFITRVFDTSNNDSTPPANPSALSTGQNADGSITLSWTAPSDSDLNGYNIYRDGVRINNDTVKGDSYKDSGVISGTLYTYMVTSIDFAGNESSGTTVSATSSAQSNIPPSAPIGIKVENTWTGDSLKIVWMPNTEADLSGYKVYVGTSAGVYSWNLDVGNDTGYTITALTEGTRYYMAVSAYDADGNESEKSLEYTGTPRAVTTRPESPSGLTVTEGNRYLTLSWTGVPNVTGYMVYIGESDGIYGTPVRTANTTYTFQNLENGKTYYVAVSSYDLYTGSRYTISSESERTASTGTPYDNEPPAVPSNVSAFDMGTGGSVALKWDRAESFDIAGYVIAYKEVGTSVFSGMASVGVKWNHSITGLTNGTTYTINVYAYDSVGNFSDPAAVAATPTSGASTADLMPPDEPVLSAVPGNGKVTLIITPAGNDADHYNLYVYNLAAGKYMPLTSINALSYEYSAGVENGKALVFVATAVDAGGNESGYSKPASAVPTELPGDIPLEEDPPVLDRVDGYDVNEIAKGFGSDIGRVNYNPNADLDGNGEIDGNDLLILGSNHGKKK